MGEGIGFAKTILFGEHFVVQGSHAIGASLSKQFSVKITPSEQRKLNIETGQIVLEDETTNLLKNDMVRKTYLGIEAET